MGAVSTWPFPSLSALKDSRLADPLSKRFHEGSKQAEQAVAFKYSVPVMSAKISKFQLSLIEIFACAEASKRVVSFYSYKAFHDPVKCPKDWPSGQR